MLPNLARLYLMAAKSLKHITVHTSSLSENIIVELQVTKSLLISNVLLNINNYIITFNYYYYYYYYYFT